MRDEQPGAFATFVALADEDFHLAGSCAAASFPSRKSRSRSATTSGASTRMPWRRPGRISRRDPAILSVHQPRHLRRRATVMFSGDNQGGHPNLFQLLVEIEFSEDPKAARIPPGSLAFTAWLVAPRGQVRGAELWRVPTLQGRADRRPPHPSPGPRARSPPRAARESEPRRH